MPLSSIKIPTVDASKLASTITETVEEAIPTDLMLNFKNDLSKSLSEFDSVPDSLSGLASQLTSLDPAGLSSALGGVGFELGDIQNFEFSIEGLGDIGSSLTAAADSLAGGVGPLLALKKQVVGITELSLEDANLTAMADNFIGGVESSVTSLIEQSSKSINDITGDLVGQATALANSLEPSLDSLAKSATLFADSMADQLGSLASNIPNGLAGNLDVTAAVGAAQKALADVQSKLTDKKINALTDSITTISEKNAGPLKEFLGNMNQAAKELTSSENLEKVKTATLGLAKVSSENIVGAKAKEITNFVNAQTVQANEYRDKKLKQKLDQAKDAVKNTKSMADKITKVSNNRTQSSALAGRQIPVAEEVIKIDKEVTNVVIFDESYFAASKFKRNIANNINLLNPAARKLFADGIKNYLAEHGPKGFDVDIISSLKSFEEIDRIKSNMSQEEIAFARRRFLAPYGIVIECAIYYRPKDYFRVEPWKPNAGNRLIWRRFSLSLPVLNIRGEVKFGEPDQNGETLIHTGFFYHNHPDSFPNPNIHLIDGRVNTKAVSDSLKTFVR